MSFVYRLHRLAVTPVAESGPRREDGVDLCQLFPGQANVHRAEVVVEVLNKTATGLPPHQYVIARRVERAKQLLRAGTDLALAEVAACAGFSDQSQFCQHFKRLTGVTPGQFRMRARTA